ncbi:MAG: pilus assembly protein TadG-related protein, partial [Actinomycetia bacterium]|nr:pilus assembly protein TadG-related protein [Actinomycetes bacterium]
MKLREKMAKRLRSEGTRAEHGAVLVIVASSLLVIMGMAAFAVDYGWIYYNQLNARKTAESAALAGVAHMPLPNCVPPVSGTLPFDTAIDIAGRNGYTAAQGDTVSPAMGSTCARLQVTVNRTIPTFFMKAFGINTLSVSETATAEHLPNLKMGSDESYLGEDPEGGSARNSDFFLAVTGDRTNKAQGDAYTSECYGDYNTSCQGSNFEFNQGFADGYPSYYYAIDVPQTVPAGSSLTVQLFDPQMNVGGVTDDRELNAPVNSGPYSNSRLRFRLLEPDATPSSWIDNSTTVCTQTYYQEDHPSYNSSQMDSWVTFCVDGAIQGVYVLEVRQTG